MPEVKPLTGGTELALAYMATVNHCGKGTETGKRGGWSHGICSQEVESEQEVGLG